MVVTPYMKVAWQYDFLPGGVVERLVFATSAMHAYGHEWSCQIVFNPRVRKGLGLTDGEGVERLWSRLRKLIPITRTSAVRIAPIGSLAGLIPRAHIEIPEDMAY